MKKIIVLFLISFSIVNSQTTETKSILNLEHQLSDNIMLQDTPKPINNVREKKSGGMAVLYSLLLPGMGELYAGDYSTGKFFTIADAVAWGFFTGFTVHGNRMEDNYKAYAKSFAGVELEGKDEKYFGIIGDYTRIGDYNNEKELNREFEKVYDVETHHWDWETSAKRKQYRNTWTSSEQAKNNVRFAVGALIVNRIVSAINAVRLVNRYNKNIADEISWNVSFGVINNPDLPQGMSVNFISSF